MTVGLVKRDSTTSVFFDGTARREFLLKRCGECGAYSQPQAEQCASCDRQILNWTPAHGGAKVIAWTVIHTNPRSGPSTETVAVVGELDEGPWWWSVLIGVEPSDVFTGMRMKIDFEIADGSEEYVPIFRPSEL